MSKYFEFIDGIAYDFKFKKLSKVHPFDYIFYLGETAIGCLGKAKQGTITVGYV